MNETTLQFHTTDRKRTAKSLPAVIAPAALFACLYLVLTGASGAPASVLPLLGGIAVSVLLRIPGRKVGRIASLGVLAAGLLALVLIPAAKEGFLRLLNGLFDASESRNAYAYTRLSVPEGDGTAAVLLALFCVAAVLGALSALCCRNRAALAAVFVAAAAFEAYFGVTPGIWKNVLLFAVLGVLLVRGETDVRSGAAAAVIMCVVLAAVLIVFPRPIAPVETASEAVRDTFGAVASNLRNGPDETASEADPTREESRQHLENADPETIANADGDAFSHETETEQLISLPHRIRLGRIILMLLGIPILILAPFLPFLAANRARRLADERKKRFAVPDNAEAIRALFLHAADWLRACGLSQNNRDFSRCAEDVERMTSAAYAKRFSETLALYQEAAYSDHPMSDAQRESVRDFARATETMLYERADRRTRFLLRYRNGLVCGEL